MKNEFTEVQYCAVELLINLSLCRQPHMILNLKDPLFFDETLNILEVNLSDLHKPEEMFVYFYFYLQNVLWPDMHERVIILLKNAIKEPTVAERFYNQVRLSLLFSL